MNNEYSTEERLIITNQVKSGANWFYWIAGLSLINTSIFLCGGSVNFVAGLGVTQLIDAIATMYAKLYGNTAIILAFIADIAFAGIFLIFGLFANKGKGWGFIVGMILYALDGLLFFIVKDYISIGFHVFALYCIFGGFKANKRLIELNKIKDDQDKSVNDTAINDPKVDTMSGETI